MKVSLFPNIYFYCQVMKVQNFAATKQGPVFLYSIVASVRMLKDNGQRVGLVDSKSVVDLISIK